MSRVLISFYQVPVRSGSNLLLCYYEVLANELKNAGNQVLLLNVAFFKKGKNNWLNSVDYQVKYLAKTVKEFNPELVITFNHQIFGDIYKIVGCPILVWDADSYEFFAGKDLLQKNLNKVFLVTSFKSLVNKYHEQIGIPKNRILIIPNATGVQREDISYTKNISFVGSLFGYNNLYNLNKSRGLYKSYINFLNSNHYDYQKFIPKATKGSVDFNTLFDIRGATLVHLLDLDLHLYGTKSWKEIEKYIPQLAYAYNDEIIFSLKQNSEIYNSSKICISISHPQTVVRRSLGGVLTLWHLTGV